MYNLCVNSSEIMLLVLCQQINITMLYVIVLCLCSMPPLPCHLSCHLSCSYSILLLYMYKSFIIMIFFGTMLIKIKIITLTGLNRLYVAMVTQTLALGA